MRWFRMLVGMLMATALVTACNMMPGQGGQQSVVGEWQADSPAGGTYQFEFSANGEFFYAGGGQWGIQGRGGTYEVSGGAINLSTAITYEGGAEVNEFEYRFEGDDLVLSHGGASLTYHRAADGATP